MAEPGRPIELIRITRDVAIAIKSGSPQETRAIATMEGVDPDALDAATGLARAYAARSNPSLNLQFAGVIDRLLQRSITALAEGGRRDIAASTLFHLAGPEYL